VPFTAANAVHHACDNTEVALVHHLLLPLLQQGSCHGLQLRQQLLLHVLMQLAWLLACFSCCCGCSLRC
jgi:hypothetical protein